MNEILSKGSIKAAFLSGMRQKNAFKKYLVAQTGSASIHFT